MLEMGQTFEWLSILVAVSVKSFIILSAAGILTRILHDASARLRHMVWCGALCSLLLLPLFPAGFQPLHVPVLPSGPMPAELAHQASSEVAEESGVQNLVAPPSDGDSFSQKNGATQARFSWWSIILLAWLTGAVLVLARFLVGIAMVRRLVARASELRGTSWTELSCELSQQLMLRRPVRLLRTDENHMPVTCGTLSAVVMLPMEAEGWSYERRRVVLLHELIHVKRRDLLTQAIAHLACAAYWFNPLVWWAVRKLRTEQEWACDERVVATGVAAPDYAGHLLEIARRFDATGLSTVTTSAMASPPLQDRLCAILRPAHRPDWSGRAIALPTLMVVILVSMAVIQLVPAQREGRIEVLTSEENEMPVAAIEGRAYVKQQSMMPANTSAEPVVKNQALRQLPSATPTPIEPVPSAPAQPVPDVVVQDAFSRFTAEEWDRLASFGIRRAYIQEMADAGYPQLTVDQLIALFTNSVHADYIEGLRSVGYDNVSIRDLLSLKTNGITPDVIRSYQAVKHAPFEAKRYVALVSNGVTPSYFKSLADAGYDSLSANKGIELHLAGITANFIYEVRGRGFVNLSPNDLIELKRREKD